MRHIKIMDHISHSLQEQKEKVDTHELTGTCTQNKTKQLKYNRDNP